LKFLLVQGFRSMARFPNIIGSDAVLIYLARHYLAPVSGTGKRAEPR